MTNIIDLPEEIVQWVASYLPGTDVKSLLCTSKDLYRPLPEIELFREIDWKFDDCYHEPRADEFSRKSDDRYHQHQADDSKTVAANDHELALTLSEHAALAGKNRR